MITTVTLNPSLDEVVILPELRLGEVNRSQRLFCYAGGKGLDVSRAVKTLGGDTHALGIVAGPNGMRLRRLLDEEAIPHDFIEVAGNTRSNLLIENVARHQETIILHQGDGRARQDLRPDLRAKIREYARRSSLMVFAGSVPAFLPATIYGELINLVRETGRKVILDSSGAAFLAGVEAGPYLIKPNRHEMEQLTGRKVATIRDAVAALETLAKFKIPVIVISLGEKGIVARHDGRTVAVDPIPTKVVSYAGAGDSLVGGLACAMDNGADLEVALRMGVAAATATLSEYGSSFFERRKCLEFMKQIKIKAL